jgi:hypothetical protein
MTGEVGGEQDIPAERRRDEHVHLVEHALHLLHQQGARTIRVDVFDRRMKREARNELGQALAVC